MRTLNLYASVNAIANAVASVTIPTASKIRGALVAIALDGTTDNGSFSVEFSKVPAASTTTNGAQDPFMVFRSWANVGAAGASWGQINCFVPLNVDCRQGEIVYLHSGCSNVTGYVNVIFYYD